MGGNVPALVLDSHLVNANTPQAQVTTFQEGSEVCPCVWVPECLSAVAVCVSLCAATHTLSSQVTGNAVIHYDDTNAAQRFPVVSAAAASPRSLPLSCSVARALYRCALAVPSQGTVGGQSVSLSARLDAGSIKTALEAGLTAVGTLDGVSRHPIMS